MTPQELAGLLEDAGITEFSADEVGFLSNYVDVVASVDYDNFVEHYGLAELIAQLGVESTVRRRLENGDQPEEIKLWLEMEEQLKHMADKGVGPDITDADLATEFDRLFGDI